MKVSVTEATRRLSRAVKTMEDAIKDTLVVLARVPSVSNLDVVEAKIMLQDAIMKAKKLSGQILRRKAASPEDLEEGYETGDL